MKKVSFAAMIIALWGVPTVTSAQCVQGAVSCMNHATLPQRSCSASVMCGGFSTDIGTITATMSNNVIACSPMVDIFSTPFTFSIRAVANTSAPATRSCAWHWISQSNSMSGILDMAEADGLPVELLEFSTDGD